MHDCAIQIGSFCIIKDTASTEIYTYGHTLTLHDSLPILVEEDRQPLPAVDMLDAAPTVERRVDMVAGGDEDGFAVDRHLSTALDDIIEFVVGAQLRVGQLDRKSVV